MQELGGAITTNSKKKKKTGKAQTRCQRRDGHAVQQEVPKLLVYLLNEVIKPREETSLLIGVARRSKSHKQEMRLFIPIRLQAHLFDPHLV